MTGATTMGRADPHAAFREHVLGLLAGRPGTGAVLVEGELRLRTGGVSLDLREILLELRSTAPEEAEEVLTRWVDGRLAGRDGSARWDEAAPLLRTGLRGASQAAEAEGLGVAWVGREVLPFLVETAVLALPGWAPPVSEARARAWGKGAGEVLARARENSAARAGEAVHRHDDGSGTTWHVDAGDLHGAGRLVLPGFLASFRGRVEGRPVAIVPARGHLHVGGEGSEAMVRWLAARARAAFQESPGAVSAALYTLGDGGDVVPYRRDGEGPAANEVRLGHLLLAAREYAARRAELQGALGSGALVAGLSLAARQPDGKPFAWTAYGEGIPCVLPLADVVGVGPPGQPPAGWLRLEELEAAAGAGFGRVVLGGLPYLDARPPLSAEVARALRQRLEPEPRP